MRRQQHQSRRRHAFHSAGLADRCRTELGQFRAQFVGKTRERGVVEIRRELERFVRPLPFDILALPFEIDAVLGVRV